MLENHTGAAEPLSRATRSWRRRSGVAVARQSARVASATVVSIDKRYVATSGLTRGVARPVRYRSIASFRRGNSRSTECCSGRGGVLDSVRCSESLFRMRGRIHEKSSVEKTEVGLLVVIHHIE